MPHHLRSSVPVLANLGTRAISSTPVGVSWDCSLSGVCGGGCPRGLKPHHVAAGG